MATGYLYLGQYRVVLQHTEAGAGNTSLKVTRAQAPVFFDTVIAALKKYAVQATYFSQEVWSANALASISMIPYGIDPKALAAFQSLSLDNANNPTEMNFVFYRLADVNLQIVIQAAYSPLS